MKTTKTFSSYLIFIVTALVLPMKSMALPAEQEAPIRIGAIVEVESYDPKSEIFGLILPAEPAMGPNRATLADLAAALKGVNVKKDPTSLIGNQYKLDKELVMLSDLGVRKQTLKKKAHK